MADNAALAAEIDATGKEIDATQALLSKMENAHTAKLAAIAEARTNLDRARHELERVRSAGQA